MWLALIITVVLTTLIVWAEHWIKKHKDTHPEIYKNRYTFRVLLYLILQGGDL
ncbi:MAG TPA: hypothetical protein VD884_09485 [Ohtaekwangia sp.]|nr:hypothetical protein [Ohtaekwangia sp.]